MDPIDQFKERYQQYAQKQSTQPIYVKPAGKSFFNKFYVQGLIVGIIIVASSVLIYMNFQPTKQTTNTAPKSTQVKATPAPKIQITDAQIDEELRITWQQYYSQVKDDPKYRESAKNALIKRTAVLAGASKYNLNLSSIASDNPAVKEIQTEDQLAQKVLSWRNIDYAYVYIDPTNPKYTDYPSKAVYSYNLIKSNLSKGESFKQAYESASKDPKFFRPIVAYYNQIFYKNDWGKTVSDELFKYKKGEDTEIISPPGGVFILAHINDTNDTQFTTMNEWIKSQNQ